MTCALEETTLAITYPFHSIFHDNMCRHKCLRDFSKNCYNCTVIQALYPKKTRLCKKTLDENDEIDCPVGNLMENLVFVESCLKNCKDDCSNILVL
ncbi:UNVERIFIED_CONTAM: hypothetical protein NCL1_28064 [Trichonephila clavipes]